MKSPMIMSASYIPDEEKSNYTEMEILESAAGYYIGTRYWDAELKFWDAGSRDSAYFATYEEAEKFLKMVEKVTNPTEYLRVQP